MGHLLYDVAQEPANGGFGSIIMEEDLELNADAAAADGCTVFQELVQQLVWIAQHHSISADAKHADSSNATSGHADMSSAAGTTRSAESSKRQQQDDDSPRAAPPNLDPTQAGTRPLTASPDAVPMELDTLRSQVAELQAQLQAASGQAAEKCEALQQQCEELQAELAASQQAAEQAQALRQQVQEQQAKLDVVNDAAKSKDELSEQVRALQAEVLTLRQAADSDEAESHLGLLRSELAATQQQAASLQQTLDAAQAELQTLRQSNAEFAERLRQQASEMQAGACEQHERRAESLQEQLTAATAQSEAADLAADKAQSDSRTRGHLDRELNEAHMQIERLQQQLAGQQAGLTSRQPSESGQSLDPSGSMLLAQSDLVEAADAAIQVCFALPPSAREVVIFPAAHATGR